MSPLEIIIFLPILAAFAVWLGAPARPTAVIASLVNLGLVIALFAIYQGGAYQGHMAFQHAITVLDAPEIRFAVGADGISLTMALLTTLVTWAAVWSIVDKDRLYQIASLLISAGALGAFLCTDVFFLYAFHELALIPTFLMIALYGYGNKKAVAWKVTLYLGAGSLILLAGPSARR